MVSKILWVVGCLEHISGINTKECAICRPTRGISGGDWDQRFHAKVRDADSDAWDSGPENVDLVDRIARVKWANGKLVDRKMSWSACATRRPGVENKQSAVHTRFSERQRGRSDQSTSDLESEGTRIQGSDGRRGNEGGNEGSRGSRGEGESRSERD